VGFGSFIHFDFDNIFSSTFGQKMLEDGFGISQQSVNSGSQQSGFSNQEVSSGEVVVIDQYGNVVDPSTSSTNVQTPGGVPSTGSSDFSSNVLTTFTHPKILGMILIFVIGFFSILLLTQSSD